MEEINLDEIINRYLPGMLCTEDYEQNEKFSMSIVEFKEAMKNLSEKLLQIASEESEICIVKYDKEGKTKINNLGQEVCTERENEYITTDKESITNLINRIK